MDDWIQLGPESAGLRRRANCMRMQVCPRALDGCIIAVLLKCAGFSVCWALAIDTPSYGNLRFGICHRVRRASTRGWSAVEEAGAHVRDAEHQCVAIVVIRDNAVDNRCPRRPEPHQCGPASAWV